MGLSGQHSNNYEKLLKQRRQILASIPDEGTISEPEPPVKRINEHGETEVHCITTQQKRLTPPEICEIVKAYNAGKSTYALAKQYGCHRASISNALKSVGITPRKGNTQNKLDEPKVVSMYENYHTIAEIAEHFAVDPHTIARCLKRNNVTMRRRGDYFKR